MLYLIFLAAIAVLFLAVLSVEYIEKLYM